MYVLPVYRNCAVSKNYISNFSVQVKDEWKDFEEKQQVDVSDLKVGNLNLSDEENDGSDADCDEDGNNADGKKDSVWSVEPKAKPSVCDVSNLKSNDMVSYS